MKNYNLLPVFVFLVGLVLGSGAVFLTKEKLPDYLSSQEAGEKAIAFINEALQEGAVASLMNINEEGGVYKIHLKIEDKEYDSFITKDGKLLFPNAFSLEEPKLDDFAKCLTEKGVKFYGAWWCSHCQNQKNMFGGSFQYVDYIECEKTPDVSRGSMTDTCQQAKIASFPTWDFPDGERKTGEILLEDLSKLSGCPLK